MSDEWIPARRENWDLVTNDTQRLDDSDDATRGQATPWDDLEANASKLSYQRKQGE